MYYIYLIRNITTKETYIGYTDDLRRRFKEHHNKNPELIYYEAYKNKKDAQERERKLKQRGQSVRWLKSRLKDSLK
ncbi:MAG: GIY-YIG nuclease family protein [Patescibacteria group bacterium]